MFVKLRDFRVKPANCCGNFKLSFELKINCALVEDICIFISAQCSVLIQKHMLLSRIPTGDHLFLIVDLVREMLSRCIVRLKVAFSFS